MPTILEVMQTRIGMNEEHDYAWARTSSYQGGQLLRAAGVVRIKHNDTTAL